MGELHPVFLAVAPDGQFQPFRQRVDHRDAHAVQAARDLVGVVVGGVLELPARVELGHDHFGRRDALLGMDAGGNAAPVVFDRDRAIGVQFDQHQVAMPGQRLVDGVVRHFEHHVVQARAVVGIADVHAGALAHRVQALEDLDRVGAIGVGVGRVFVGAGHSFAHRHFARKTQAKWGRFTQARGTACPLASKPLARHFRCV
jgi:hypothetical protein